MKMQARQVKAVLFFCGLGSGSQWVTRSNTVIFLGNLTLIKSFHTKFLHCPSARMQQCGFFKNLTPGDPKSRNRGTPEPRKMTPNPKTWNHGK